ncbi:hypothetical protein [Bacillus horti]|uniref:Outer membrane receptor protein involved in Fe transport n=1 Tax=Caldalkalibacillus horti TaxID=77523 RepID=A0ABT9VZD4_9BACI|nr:hypothetical protein [Bacillus horti]MDQ0166357.1 outer membrane receptor protein involved in Fe transport [Bacillus horti]
MKRWQKTAALSTVLGAMLLGTTAGANTNGLGSVNDPLVTKSYVDQQIAKVSGGSTGGGGGVEVESTLKVVQLQTGQQLIGQAGTEIIVRTGQVKGLVSPGGDGLSDVTEGVDIRGTRVPANHLILIPRTDGRGIEVTKGPSSILVRGSYEIKK